MDRALRPPGTPRRVTAVGRRAGSLERRHVLDGPRHVIGEDGEPDFQNDWVNVGGSAVPLSFRRLAGGGVEIQGSIASGTLGTVAFTLPAEYRPEYDVRINGSDDDGNLVVWIVYANGDVQVGLA